MVPAGEGILEPECGDAKAEAQSQGGDESPP